MRATYYPGDDILVLRFNDREIVREVSQDWHINVAFDADGTVVQMVILEAVASKFMDASVPWL